MDKHERERLAFVVSVRYDVHAMNTKTTIPISEARRTIFDIAEEVQKPGKYYTLTENGKPKAVIMSAEEFESLVETLDIMQEMPDLAQDIRETREDYKTGAYKNYVTLEELLAKDGFYVADKGSKTYGVSHTTKTKSPKRAR